MKKLFLFVLCCAASVWAQTTSGTITGTGTSGSAACLEVNVYGKGSVGIVVTNSGTAWTGTIQPQVIVENDPNGTAGNVQVTPSTSAAPQSTITANGTYFASVAGATYFLVCGNTVTNIAAVKLTPVPLAANRNAGPGVGTFLNTGGGTIAITGPTQNATKLWGFIPPQNITFTTISYSVTTTADNTANLYDIGILDSAGNIVAHSGATAGTTFSPATGAKNIAMLATATLIAGNKYYIAWTTNAASSPASLGGQQAGSFLVNGAGATTSGGILAAGSPPADAYSIGNFPGITLHS